MYASLIYAASARGYDHRLFYARAEKLTQKNFNPVLETTSSKTFEIENPFSKYKTYMSNLTLLTNANFSIHGSITISIGDIPVIKESDAELIKGSNTVIFPINNIILTPRAIMSITIKSSSGTSVSAAVLFTLATEPLPADYFVEPQNQAEINELFSNAEGERILFEDKSRDMGEEYAIVNMEGYKNVYATLISRANDLEIDNVSNRLDNASNVEHFKTFFKSIEPPSTIFIRINRKPDPAPDFSLQFSLRFRTSLVGTLKPAALVNPKLYISEMANQPILYEGAVDYDLSVTDGGTYTYLRFKINARDIPPESNNMFASLTFSLDGTNAQEPNSYSSFAYEVTYTNQPETGTAHVTFEINANDIWVELDDFPSVFVNVNGTKTVLVGEHSGHILPSGDNILRAKLETRSAPLRTEVVLLRV